MASKMLSRIQSKKVLQYLILVMAFAMFSGCSDDNTDGSSGNGTDGTGTDGTGTDGTGTDGTGTDGTGTDGTGTDGTGTDGTGTDGTSTDNICESVSAGAELEPVYLAFAFDVSGSMGQLDKPWHDPVLKWEPVVAATTSFLEDPASNSFVASMTFFPADNSDKCEAASYEEADVPMTKLPSDKFSAALTQIREDGWRGGTPTLAVMDGIQTYIEDQKKTTPGNYAIVLVTDGYPEGCGDDDDISLVADMAAAAAKNGVKTYVIGVNNPDIDGAPPTLENLKQVAVAGGTGDAFIIETGDADQTAADFRNAIDQIKSAAFSCVVTIPEPPNGATFDKQNVIVTATADGKDISLSYDPTCGKKNAWKYDDTANPKQLLLCDSTCSSLESETDAALKVEFTCEQTIIVID